MWAVSLEQLEEILEDPRYQGGFFSRWNPSSADSRVTFRDVFQRIIRADTLGKGIGYAMLKNHHQPLKARVVICHSWEDDYAEFVSNLQASGEKGPFWLCGMAVAHEDGAPGSLMGTLAEAFLAA